MSRKILRKRRAENSEGEQRKDNIKGVKENW